MAMSQYTREETFQRSTGGLANRFKFIFEIKYSTNSTFHLNKRIFKFSDVEISSSWIVITDIQMALGCLPFRNILDV